MNLIALSELCEWIKDGAHASPQVVESGRPYLTSRNVRCGELDLSEIWRISEVDFEAIYRRCPTQPGDIWLTKDGASVGNAAINELEYPVALLSSIAVLRPRTDVVTPHTLLSWILSSHGQATIKSAVAGNAITRVTLEQIKALRAMVPNAVAQQSIEKVYPLFRRLDEQFAEVLDRKRTFKRGLMQQLLTGQKRFPEFMGSKWSQVCLGEICTLTNGHSFREEEWATAGLPIVRIGNLNGSGDFNYFAGTPESEWTIENGELLFAWSGTRGTSFGPHMWAGGRAVLNQHIFRVLPRPGIDKRWLHQMLRFLTVQIEGRAHGGSGIVHVRKSDLVKRAITLPDSDEQRRIAETLQLADQEIELIAAQRDQFESFRRALLSKLLSGSLPVPP